MKAKYTPGPWEETYCPKEGWGVCVADGGDVLADGTANKSDALLMAAAPDLLDALEWIVEFCDEHPEWTAEQFCNGDPDCAEAAWLEAARSIIAKATK